MGANPYYIVGNAINRVINNKEIKTRKKDMKNNILKLEMFEVACKCGHVGKGYYVEVHFPIMAMSGKEAAHIAREMPRVKHDQKDAILGVSKIGKERYNKLVWINDHDPYLRCKNIQEQNLIDLTDRLIEERRSSFCLIRRDESDKHFYCNKRKLRNPKKYMNRYFDDIICA